MWRVAHAARLGNFTTIAIHRETFPASAPAGAVGASPPKGEKTMPKFIVTVRRIVREDTQIVIEAKDEKNAVDLAIDEATVVTPDKWECYDCDYFCDLGDAVKVEKAESV
jgi:hypothetical protein